MNIRSKPMRILLACLSAIFVMGCYNYDEVSRSYTTLTDALEDIQKGWIPDCLPSSTHHISDSHNLDTNRGEGSFEFAPADFATFQAGTPLTDSDLSGKKLISRDWQSLKDVGYRFVAVAEFIIAVHPSGKGRYWLSLDGF